VIQLGPTQTRILEDGRTTGHRHGLGEITLAPHTGGPPPHRHARHDEGFYVVSGRARFTVGETTYEAAAGTLVPTLLSPLLSAASQQLIRSKIPAVQISP
jgi:quercetin dioxygenase-like cupin family protein